MLNAEHWTFSMMMKYVFLFVYVVCMWCKKWITFAFALFIWIVKWIFLFWMTKKNWYFVCGSHNGTLYVIFIHWCMQFFPFAKKTTKLYGLNFRQWLHFKWKCHRKQCISLAIKFVQCTIVNITFPLDDTSSFEKLFPIFIFFSKQSGSLRFWNIILCTHCNFGIFILFRAQQCY